MGNHHWWDFILLYNRFQMSLWKDHLSHLIWNMNTKWFFKKINLFFFLYYPDVFNIPMISWVFWYFFMLTSYNTWTSSSLWGRGFSKASTIQNLLFPCLCVLYVWAGGFYLAEIQRIAKKIIGSSTLISLFFKFFSTFKQATCSAQLWIFFDMDNIPTSSENSLKFCKSTTWIVIKRVMNFKRHCKNSFTCLYIFGLVCLQYKKYYHITTNEIFILYLYFLL